MATLNEWVIQAPVTDDPVGDFIDDTQMVIRVGRRPPPVITRRSQLETYLWSRRESHEAMATVPAVWRRYERWLKRRGVST